jgi:DeoR/GlpR family transcriptional regulator of sugar metabolism
MSSEWYTSKAQSDRKVTRIKDIYMFIKKKGPVTRDVLCEEYGVSIRTIERDLSVLIHNKLVYNPKRGWWAVTDRKVKGGTND